MRYQNPQLLYFLFAIAIPILIHLFNFRKHKTIYFSSIRFLKEIKEDKRKRTNLKNLLILLSRILAISFLVFAFAKPYIPTKNSLKVNNIFLYVDNSLSMDVDYGDGNLLNKAKNKAIQITNAYTRENNFFLITNDFLTKDNSSYSADAIKTQIEKIKYSSRQRSISDIISRMNIINSESNHLYFISDMQENTLKINSVNKARKDSRISLIPIKNIAVDNISIDSCFTSSPIFMSDKEIELKVVIRNTSNKDITDKVIFLYIDNQQKSQQYISLLANEVQEKTFRFLTDNKKIISGEIRLNDYPISYDNSLFFTLKKSNKINVFVINKENENPALNSLLEKDTSLFSYVSSSTKNINYNSLLKQDFLILNGVIELSSGILSALQTFVESGGSMLVIPPNELSNIVSYNIMLKSLGLNTIYKEVLNELKINKFKFKHPIYENVFKKKIDKINYPLSKQSYKLNNTTLNTQIIGFSNQSSFLTSYSIKKGIIYQFSSPLNSKFNNFTKHALFVPTLINIAISSIKTKLPYYIIGADNEILSNHKSIERDIPHISGMNIDIIPTITNKDGKQTLNVHNQITKSGVYNLEYNNIIASKFAFNYNNSESTITTLAANELQKLINKNEMSNIDIISSNNEKIISSIEKKINGKEFWKIALIFSLLFFAIEILLIKLIKS